MTSALVFNNHTELYHQKRSHTGRAEKDDDDDDDNKTLNTTHSAVTVQHSNVSEFAIMENIISTEELLNKLDGILIGFGACIVELMLYENTLIPHVRAYARRRAEEREGRDYYAAIADADRLADGIIIDRATDYLNRQQQQQEPPNRPQIGAHDNNETISSLGGSALNNRARESLNMQQQQQQPPNPPQDVFAHNNDEASQDAISSLGGSAAVEDLMNQSLGTFPAHSHSNTNAVDTAEVGVQAAEAEAAEAVDALSSSVLVGLEPYPVVPRNANALPVSPEQRRPVEGEATAIASNHNSTARCNTTNNDNNGNNNRQDAEDEDTATNKRRRFN